MNDPAVIRVLVIDDHPLVTRGIVSVLSGQPGIEVVGEAHSGQAGILAFKQTSPDVTLMDLRMPDIDGATAIATLRRQFPEARFLVLTTYDGEEDVFGALEAGAQGYLLKGARPEQLVDAIRTVHAGRRHVSAEVADRMVSRALLDPLTTREEQVLALLVKGRSNQEIARDLGIAERTVKNHITGLFGKIGATSRMELVLVALQRGLVRLDRG